MKALILCAGIGERLGSLARDIPKCLLRLNGGALLERQVNILHRCGIEGISVVVGVEGACWSRENHRRIKSICKNVVFNEANVSKNRVYSLFKGIENIDGGPMLIIDGDLFFEKVVIDKILESDKENLVLVGKISDDLEGKKVSVGDNGIVCFGVKEPVAGRAYINGGLMKIGKELFKDVKQKVSEPKNHDKGVSTIMDGLCKRHNIYVVTADGKWVNLNTEEDIMQAKKLAENKDMAVIWDLDGVIFDSEPLQLIAYKRAFLDQGIEIEDRDYSENTGRKDIFQRICKKYKKECDFNKWYKEKNRMYWEEINRGIETLPGVSNLLKGLHIKGYKVAVVSSTSRRNLLFILNKLGIRDYFEEVIGFEDVGKGKPDPEPYLKVAERLGINPKRCIAIEDTEVGVRAAKGAGMKCIAVTETNRIELSHKEADFIIDSLAKLNIEKLKQIMGE